jgi:hypothetical protein
MRRGRGGAGSGRLVAEPVLDAQVGDAAKRRPLPVTSVASRDHARRDDGPRTTGRPVIRADVHGEPKWNAKWSRHGRQVWRTIGPAWMESDGAGGWRPRRGRPRAGYLTDPEAIATMLALITEHDREQTRLERDADERHRRGVTFREVAAEWLEHVERVKGAGSLLAREADAVAVQAFLGHAKLTTTERYMHAKARPDDLARLDRAFAPARPPEPERQLEIEP